ncbi:SDR family NAD(P)-dependent oxidoreductase [Sphingobacterium hotanense]|uniref:SDR family NAD(P)-dependent oxidoreductase n=1 Tax=Sphingobacterium hotanense TaxID=649196 RepID=UPI0021A293ED|nr:SDR family oxidoreductase [Sphingobacterium hotanense]MCT1524038.1 SDR family oxidoreductase [Sphingobacterium hotanense]
MMDRKIMLIVGAGQRLGTSVAKRFLKDGFIVILISRNESNLNSLKQSLTGYNDYVFTYKADVADKTELKSVLEDIAEKFQTIDVLFYNAVHIVKKSILQESEADLINDFTINVIGLLTTVQTLKENLIESKGVVLVSGGGIAICPMPEYSSYSISSSALRSMVLCLNSSLLEHGVYTGILLINGAIDENSQTYSPVNLSNVFWRLSVERNLPEIVL